jgi:uncharacterized protein
MLNWGRDLFSNVTALRVVAGLLGLVVFLYGAALVVIWWRQESILFSPTVLPANHSFKLAPDVSEFTVEVPGAKLNGLHMRRANPKAIVFFVHGNTGSLDNWFVNIDFYRQMNVDLAMIDFRGFGKSTGKIQSEAQLVKDVQLAWRSIAQQYPNLPAVFIGRSLGSGLAAKVNAQLPPEQKAKLMILVSAYYSLEDLAKKHFSFVPSALVRYPIRTFEAINQSSLSQVTQVTLLHGDKDTLITIDNSQRLVQLSPGAQLITIEGAAHNDLQEFPAYLKAIETAIANLR